MAPIELLAALEPHIRASHEKLEKEKQVLLDRFRKEFNHEPKADNGKLDRVLDGMVGPSKKKRGRPKGSKNKAKPVLVRPEQIGHIPDDDLVIPRGRK